MTYYDVIIVGAGPTGLAAAQCLSKHDLRILVLDREAVVGGCHRVRRVGRFFTEHGPRIYSSTYSVFTMLLKEMDFGFEDMFVRYFSMFRIGQETVLAVLDWTELLSLAGAFSRLMLSDSYGKDETVQAFMLRKGFKADSMDLLDRICRITDGAGADRYTLNSFLQLVNAQSLKGIYQPKRPTDVGLFAVWRDFLEKKGVSIQTGVAVKTLRDARSVEMESGAIFTARKIILAVPPQTVASILALSPQEQVRDAFGPIEQLRSWAHETRYLDYISVTFHWDEKLDLEEIYGLAFRSDWGVAFIVMSDFFEPSADESQTLISCAITRPDALSLQSGKTASETPPEELKIELFRQLQDAFRGGVVVLPEPAASIVSPGNVFENGRWTSKDNAFVDSAKGFMPMQSSVAPSIFTAGTHTNMHLYRFTSLESAVTNGVALAHIIEPRTVDSYPISRTTTVSDLVRQTVLFLIVLVLVILLARNFF